MLKIKKTYYYRKEILYLQKIKLKNQQLYIRI